MKPVRKPLWVLTLLHSLLVGTLVEPSSPASRPLSVSSRVGNQAVLPCSWKQRLGKAPPACHVQWATPDDTVFELRGDVRWAAAAFRGRLEVPADGLGAGDCSLVIRDVQIGDAGRYESFMLLDGLRAKSRVFIQSVRLSVFDHKSVMSRGPGEDLVLDLYTRHSVRVVFQDRNSSAWAELWTREDGGSERLVKHPLDEQLTMKKLSRSDEGTYKVLDERGLAVSTVQLFVEENSTALNAQQLLEDGAPTDDVTTSGCSALLVFALLITSLQITRLV